MKLVTLPPALAPRLKPFDPTKSKATRIKQYLDAGESYQTAVRKADNDFKNWARTQKEATANA
jgi:hypothetical protein